jgi:putative transposase
MSKCEFCSSISYLGHNIYSARIGVKERKLWAVSRWERPKNFVNLQRFPGLCNYYRKFVQNVRTIATSLTNLTKNKILVEWNHRQENACTQLQEALMNTPI